ncbi:MAG: ROK family protein [Chitinophagaceae bacterium]|nr:ROK family protein [Chitinophagaceae bacterium]MCW5928007.1 ROK family protein [Chitinophagaceae bacterium]
MSAKHSLYKKKVVNHLYFSRALSCADISDKVGKSLSLTTRMLNELVVDGFVQEKGYAPSSGGRRPLMYSLKADILYIISVAVDQFVTRIAVMDMHNNVIGQVHSWDIHLATETDSLRIITSRIQEVVNLSGIDKTKILGIGISMPGFVDSKKGINYTFLKAPASYSITQYVENETGIPVYIDNDSSLIALAELRFGSASNEKNVMVINVGWGIGLGMILNRELFRGNEGLAGEFSHIPLFQGGRMCSCGKSGCLETEASLGAVIEKAIQGLDKGRASLLEKEKLSLSTPDKSALDIVEAANKGDRFAVELLSEVGYHIGRGIAILIHLLNPGRIILSGRGALVGKILQAPIQQALNEHCIPRLSSNTEIVVSSIGADAQLIGTAALVIEHYEKPLFNKRKIQEVA